MMNNLFLAVLIAISLFGCKTTRQKSTESSLDPFGAPSVDWSDPFSAPTGRVGPFTDEIFENEQKVEGIVRAGGRRAQLLKQLDGRFAVQIPEFSLDNATLDEAMITLNALWADQLGSKDTPPVLQIEYRYEEPPWEGYPGKRKRITTTLRDLSVAEILLVLGAISPHRFSMKGGTPALEEISWITEDWETRILPVSNEAKKFLKLTEQTTQEDLMRCLEYFGVDFKRQTGHNFYARWRNDLEKIVIFNLPSENRHTESILRLIDLDRLKKMPTNR